MNLGTDLDQLKIKLAEFFQAREEVLFAYLFGSLATKSSNKFSDIDVAIFTDMKKIDNREYRYGYQADVLTDLMNLLQTDKVDLILLNSAPPLLKHRIIYYGELLFSASEKERINFQVDTINRYMDYKMLQRKVS
jgi:predicted nucleotidyltransferase